MDREYFTIISFFTLLGGLSLFLFGLRLGGEHLQSIAKNRLRYIIGRLISNRFKGVGVGALSTVTLQSSSATTVMLVSFAGIGLITLLQSLSIILGAGIGTTVTVQLIAFRISDYALLILTIGFLLTLLNKESRGYRVGGVILAFGLIFFGMKVMSDSVAPLRYYPHITDAILKVGENPLLGILLATIFTAIVQSSAATLGLVLSLSFQGLMNLESAIPLVLGANVGTCATALLASLGSNVAGKRVAWGHTLFKIVGVILFYPFIGPVADLIARTSGEIPRQIANVHAFFNVGMAILFVPFIRPYGAVISALLPKKELPAREFAPKYLEETLLETPDLALGQSTREILRMADIVFEMVKKTMNVYKDNDEQLRRDLVKKDNRVDLLEERITHYLTKLSQKELTSEQVEKEIALLFITSELEQIGDLVSKNLMVYAERKIAQPFYFSDEGFGEITQFHSEVVTTLQMAINAFAAWDNNLSQKTIERRKRLSLEQNRLHRAHIDRLHQGLKESLDTTTVHMDLIGDLHQINLHASKI
ncbi:Na/Pi cotransporter family protein, partial [bacterium]|nr:Na/Pi cotransporter family protein [bacterium]